MEVNLEEVDQFRQEIKREGQLQAMKEKQKELKERIVMKLSTNCVSEEDMIKNVTEEIETRLQ